MVTLNYLNGTRKVKSRSLGAGELLQRASRTLAALRFPCLRLSPFVKVSIPLWEYVYPTLVVNTSLLTHISGHNRISTNHGCAQS